MTDLLKPDEKCWKADKATKAKLLIDCAAYYKALYQAICKAKKSIFILGWDIDGRIELMRGAEVENCTYPVRFRDLIVQKAKENPDLKIYLNRWNYSIFFANEREPFSGYKWTSKTPDNVHYCADYKIPFTACHHQKVIVIDDQIAFCGGMDIALERWDNRRHAIYQDRRHDPDIFHTKNKVEYQPYHDIQIVVEGPIVYSLATLVRDRWEKGAGYSAAPLFENPLRHSPWPEYLEPDWIDIRIGISRTLPKTRNQDAVEEIKRLYCDEIARAEKFIYIENQYLTAPEIATAINKRLKENKDLRVLAVSADHPRGIMEHKAMWSGRAQFCDIAAEGIDNDRFIVAYPVTTDGDKQKTIHIHSKLMIVDDKFLHIGSSNMNNRSMGFDTECDLTLTASTQEHAKKINDIRNDLIREHTGLLLPEICKAMMEGDVKGLLKNEPESRQHLVQIDNEPYRNEALSKYAIKIGDPKKAYILYNLPIRQILFFAIIIGLVIFAASSLITPEMKEFLSPDKVKEYVESAQSNPMGVLYIAALYILAGAVFFPVTVLNLTTAIVFGPLYGLAYALIGSLASASAAYGVGALIGDKLTKYIRPVIERIRKYTLKGGIAGMTMVRLIPIAPFTVVNLTFGVARISFLSYILATAFGLIPGIFAKAMLGGAIGELWKNPEPRVILFVVGSILLWIGIIWGSHKLYKHYQKEIMA